MKGVLVDSNVILDVFLDDPNWAEWSESVLEEYITLATLFINSIIYSEVSIAFDQIESLEAARSVPYPTGLAAIYLNGKFLSYEITTAKRFEKMLLEHMG